MDRCATAFDGHLCSFVSVSLKSEAHYNILSNTTNFKSLSHGLTSLVAERAILADKYLSGSKSSWKQKVTNNFAASVKSDTSSLERPFGSLL